MLNGLCWRGRRPARPGARRLGPMARRRRLSGQPALALLILGGAATAALTQTISLANRVVTTRAEIDALRGEKTYLEASIAQLESEWNRLATRDAIVPRAERELGLVTPAGPGAVVVVTDGTFDRDHPAWRRALGVVGAGDAVSAAAAEERLP